MLLSMTGHGHSGFTEEALSLTVELRTVNSRYAKINVRCGESYQFLEPRIEELIRKRIRRGTVQANVKIERKMNSGSVQINQAVLSRYIQSVESAGTPPDRISVELLLGLPGVIEQTTENPEIVEEEWNRIESTLSTALDNLDEMRAAEGRSMETDLMKNCDLLESGLAEIAQRAPLVVENYQKRLREKIQNLLIENSVDADTVDVVKEVGVFADKADISEEVVRLQAHIDQFRNVIQANESQGRKLDFLTQEMFRETNTIGSKASDSQISQGVVELKTVIERIREMVQNIE